MLESNLAVKLETPLRDLDPDFWSQVSNCVAEALEELQHNVVGLESTVFGHRPSTGLKLTCSRLA